MQSIFLRRLLYICCLVLPLAGGLKAQFEEGRASQQLNSISCTQALPSVPNTVPYAPLGEQTRKIRNLVRLKIDELATTNGPGTPLVYFKSGFTATATLKVELWNSITTAGSAPDQTLTKVLTVNFDRNPGAKYNPIAYILLNPTGSYEQVRVTINSISISGLTNGWTNANVLPLLSVENEMDVLRYYTLSGNATLLTPINFSGTYDGVNHSDQLSVSYKFPSGANENTTQLEYAWVESETKAFYNVGGVFSSDLLFRTNSTRVDVDFKDTSYKYNVPLLFPADSITGGGGTLYYRVRAVLRKNNGNLITGPWSTVKTYTNNGHQRNVNWQATTDFAENGKSKTIAQYFDGTLRVRQTVTKDNTTGNTTVAETIYNLQGKPDVQILPTPTDSTSIHYFTDFNRFAGQTTNDDPAKYFDLTVAGNQCVGAPALDKTRGNGKYYSPNNPWTGTEASARLIPDANGYGYTETKYTNDPSARVASQSTAGQAFQVGSGHETKYYYGKPTQNELDALFGTEAGDATHYYKNMVQDANGQMSVSYLDMHGRTVATSLTGAAPTNVNTINNNAAFYPASSDRLTNNLLTATNNVVRNNSTIESISTMLVAAPTIDTFVYKLTPAILQQADTAGHPICFDCKYDLEISIRPEGCTGAAPIVKRFSNLQIEPAGQACTTSMGFTGDGVSTPTYQVSFPVTLAAGSWVIRKTLTLNDSMFQIRRDSAMKVFLAKNLQYVQDSVFAAMSSASACGTPAVTRDCSACQAQLGTYATYKANYIAALGGTTTMTDADIHAMYTQDSLACAEACMATVNPLSNPLMSTLGQLRMQMLSDMIPFVGQYANKADTIADTSLVAKYNIFKTTYTGTFGSFGTKPFYKNPVTEPSGAASFYANPDGTADMTIYPNGSGDHTILNGLADTTFSAMFDRDWAGQLIYYHPEYGRLRFAETTMAGSYGWLDSVMACDSYTLALSRGYMSPLTNDPYFKFNGNAGYVPADRTLMNTYLTAGVNPSHADGNTIWRIANGLALVDTTLPTILRSRAMAGMNSTGIDASATTTAQKDAVWQSFRNEYLYYRNDMLTKYVNAQQAGSLSANAAALLQLKGKQLHFVSAQNNADQNGWSWWATATTASSGPGDSVGLGNQGSTYVATQHNVDQCAAQRPFWQGKLMQCEQLQQYLQNQTHGDSVTVNTIINKILDSLVMVCHNSVNGNNPSGATNVNPAVPSNPSNFEDIINHVFTQYGIATLPSNNYFCNPYSVDYPKPYNANPPVFARQSEYVDTCNCGQFHIVKQAAKVAGYDTTSMSSMNSYLRVTYNDTLTLGLWQGLQKCNGYTFLRDTCLYSGLEVADTCFKYYRPIAMGSTVTVPSFLTCGYVQPCVTCATLQTYTLSFRSLYPAYVGVPYTGVLDSNMVRQNALWARYLNFKTGLSVTVSDYAAAYAACNYGTAPAYLLLTNRSTQPPSGSQLPLLYTASDSVVFYQEYTSLDTDNFETLLSGFTSNSGYALCDIVKPITSIALPDTTHSNPCQGVQEQSRFVGLLIFQQRKDSLIANFDSLYRAKCMSAQSAEMFYATYQPSEYHYTLYYYDQAGNLVKTLSPAAVKPNFNLTYLGKVDSTRRANGDLSNGTNIENMATQYRYNSMGQIVAQRTPDAGISRFWYDRLDRLVVSQNALQAANAAYGYILYDALGRTTEVGQKPQNTAMTQTISQDTTALKNWLADLTSGGTKVQITRTIYDLAYPGFSGTAPLAQMNLRNRISYMQIIDADNNNTVPYRTATFYSYNIHGGVDTLVQDYGTSSVMSANGNRFKLIKYDYDLVSGKVNQVSYQPGKVDAFYHQYTYDAENRVMGVRTSRDSILWESDAAYQYYRHGLLARTQLGSLQVQGIDYAYTLQGWMKSINPSWSNDGTGDLYDSDGTSATPLFERDAYKLNLHYYDDGTYTDYKPISAPTGYVQGNTLPSGARFNLYNGNISSAAVSLRKLATGAAYNGALIYNYKYDQLNRINSMDAWAANGSFGPTGSGPMQDYAERFSYDPNGNLMNLVRHGTTGYGLGLTMDSLKYNYAYVKTDGTTAEYTPGAAPGSGVDHLTNQLSSITDGITSTGYDDVKNQAALNYRYNQVGGLISDVQAGITNITWSIYGKILSLTNASGTITYGYDAAGYRISKTAGGITTWYVRDATGKVIATYVQGDGTKNGGALTETEISIYGNNRLGVLNLNQSCTLLTVPDSNAWVRGSKLFELTNHLGNVLVTITDKKLQRSTDSSTVVYYTPDVASANDYYVFGMQMPGRVFNNGGYRYGFNGQEKSDEVKGIGNSYTAEYWEYDPRLGRRWNTDPVISYNFSPYVAFENNPVLINDVSGACPNGNCGTEEINAAYEIVKKNFNPKKNLIKPTDKLDEDATKWFFDRVEAGKYPKGLTVESYAVFRRLVDDVWERAFAASAVGKPDGGKFEQYDKIIESMSTPTGKALAIISLTEQDKKNVRFFSQVLIPNVFEFLVGAAFTTLSLDGAPAVRSSRTVTVRRPNMPELFSDIPAGASKPLGQRGEDLTELMLRRAYPNATIGKQVHYYFGRNSFTKVDFVVMEENRILVVIESKVNKAVMTGPQTSLIVERQAGQFGGKAAKGAGMEGMTITESTIRAEIRYNSITGRSQITYYPW